MAASHHLRDEPACVVDHVSLLYGGREALRDVSLRIEVGETVAIVGPSGAGKTSLLRLVAGILPPTSGQILLHGCAVEELRGRGLDRVVGMIQQRLDLIPQLSVKHNVQAGLLGRWGLLRSLAALLLPVEVPSARDAVARVGIEDKFAERVSHLSGGEQQRVALARLLVQDPLIILADEPVSSLDPARAEDLVVLLRDLALGRGRSLIASLHAPELARRHFDRIVGLRDGAVAFDLPARAVTTDLLDAVYRLPGGAGVSPAMMTPVGIPPERSEATAE